MLGKRRFFSQIAHLLRRSGKTSGSVMLFVWKATTSSQPMSFCSARVNRRALATSRPRTWTGMSFRSSLRSALPLTNSTPNQRETNLKIKQASPQTSHMTSPHLVTQLHGTLRSEHPNSSLYTYEGTLELRDSMGIPKTIPLGPDQMLLRGAQIRNTPWSYGLVVFTGHETKLMRNATYVSKISCGCGGSPSLQCRSYQTDGS